MTLAGAVAPARLVHAVVGVLTPYLWEWGAFETPTVDGLAMVRGDRIDLLAMVAKPEGKGHGGRFLAALMAHYATVGVWEVWNPQLAAMLRRRGFTVARSDFDGEQTDGFLWRRAPGGAR